MSYISEVIEQTELKNPNPAKRDTVENKIRRLFKRKRIE